MPSRAPVNASEVVSGGSRPHGPHRSGAEEAAPTNDGHHGATSVRPFVSRAPALSRAVALTPAEEKAVSQSPPWRECPPARRPSRSPSPDPARPVTFSDAVHHRRRPSRRACAARDAPSPSASTISARAGRGPATRATRDARAGSGSSRADPRRTSAAAEGCSAARRAVRTPPGISSGERTRARRRARSSSVSPTTSSAQSSTRSTKRRSGSTPRRTRSRRRGRRWTWRITPTTTSARARPSRSSTSTTRPSRGWSLSRPS